VLNGQAGQAGFNRGVLSFVPALWTNFLVDDSMQLSYISHNGYIDYNGGVIWYR